MNTINTLEHAIDHLRVLNQGPHEIIVDDVVGEIEEGYILQIRKNKRNYLVMSEIDYTFMVMEMNRYLQAEDQKEPNSCLGVPIVTDMDFGHFRNLMRYPTIRTWRIGEINE